MMAISCVALFSLCTTPVLSLIVVPVPWWHPDVVYSYEQGVPAFPATHPPIDAYAADLPPTHPPIQDIFLDPSQFNMPSNHTPLGEYVTLEARNLTAWPKISLPDWHVDPQKSFENPAEEPFPISHSIQVNSYKMTDKLPAWHANLDAIYRNPRDFIFTAATHPPINEFYSGFKGDGPVSDVPWDSALAVPLPGWHPSLDAVWTARTPIPAGHPDVDKTFLERLPSGHPLVSGLWPPAPSVLSASHPSLDSFVKYRAQPFPLLLPEWHTDLDEAWEAGIAVPTNHPRISHLLRHHLPPGHPLVDTLFAGDIILPSWHPTLGSTVQRRSVWSAGYILATCLGAILFVLFVFRLSKRLSKLRKASSTYSMDLTEHQLDELDIKSGPLQQQSVTYIDSEADGDVLYANPAFGTSSTSLDTDGGSAHSAPTPPVPQQYTRPVPQQLSAPRRPPAGPVPPTRRTPPSVPVPPTRGGTYRGPPGPPGRGGGFTLPPMPTDDDDLLPSAPPPPPSAPPPRGGPPVPALPAVQLSARRGEPVAGTRKAKTNLPPAARAKKQGASSFISTNSSSMLELHPDRPDAAKEAIKQQAIDTEDTKLRGRRAHSLWRRRGLASGIAATGPGRVVDKGQQQGVALYDPSKGPQGAFEGSHMRNAFVNNSSKLVAKLRSPDMKVKKQSSCWRNFKTVVTGYRIGDWTFGHFMFLIIYLALNFLSVVVCRLATNEPVFNVTALGRHLGSLAGANSMVLVIPAARNSIIGWLLAVPYDHVVIYHRLLGRITLLLVLLHFVFSIWASESMESDKYWLSGIGSAACGFVLFATSVAPVRRACFNIFYFSHYLFIGYFVFGGLHCFECRVFAIIGASIIGLDRFLRMLTSIIPRKTTQFRVKGTIAQIRFPKSLISRALGMHSTGQYYFVNFPSLSPFEWHPFSVSSGPREDGVELHVRALGNHTAQIVAKAKVMSAAGHPTWIRAEGPFGGQSFNYRRYPVLLLVGGGVGITPIIGFLKDIYNVGGYNNEERKRITPHVMESVYAVWVMAEEAEAGCFMSELEDCLKHAALVPQMPSLRVWIYVTRSKAQQLEPPLTKGRPQFQKIMEHVEEKHQKKPTLLFACGPDPMVAELWDLSMLFTANGTMIDFHHEIFNF